MAAPVPSHGAGKDHGAPRPPRIGPDVNRGRAGLFVVAVALALGQPAAALAMDLRRESEDGPRTPGFQRRAITDEEIEALWAAGPVRRAAHRSYIYIDEEDIVEGDELPVFRVEASRLGYLRRLQRLARGDPGLHDRIADLAPELARETEWQRRSNESFYARRPGVARDVPDPGNLLAPLVEFVRSRR